MAQIPSHILKELGSLNSDKNPKYWDERTKGRAPHKPFLLLSILDGIEQGWISDNYIDLSQNLIETFFEYWNSIVGNDRVTTIALPFFHMQSEPFWKLHYKDGKKEYKNSPSLGGLTDRIKYAEADEHLFSMFKNPDNREAIRSFLLSQYFSDETAVQVAKVSRFNYQAYDYAVQLEAFAAEPFMVDHSHNKLKYRKSKTQVRDAGFSRAVRKAYHYTCAVCRDRVITQEGKTLVEGAHIIPRSQSNNDDPRNGIALCKTHHWMYDQYLLTIKPDYCIQLSKWLKENKNRVDHLWDYNKKTILLPDQQKYFPAQQALEIHFKKFREIQ